MIDARELMEEKEESDDNTPPFDMPGPRRKTYNVGIRLEDNSMIETTFQSWEEMVDYLRELPDLLPVETLLARRGGK